MQTIDIGAASHPEFDGHEQIRFHTDEQTGLRAIVAIHSTRLGLRLVAAVSTPTRPTPKRLPTRSGCQRVCLTRTRWPDCRSAAARP